MSGARSRRRDAAVEDHDREEQQVKVRLGIGVACRAAHRAACADETGRIVWSGHRFSTRAEELQALWARLPGDAAEVLVVVEPTRNAWVPLAGWFRRRGATVVLVPSEQSADLRAYYAKHAKTDRLDAELLARLPLLHPDGLHPETTNGPGDPLKRGVKLRSGLVRRRTACMQRLDALLEILGPDWVEALGSDMTQTTFKFLAGWANPHVVKRIGRARLARWFQRQTRKAWGQRRADAVVAAAAATLALWGPAGLDYEALARRYRRRSQPRAGALAPDRPPRRADLRPVLRRRPRPDPAVGPRRRQGPRRPDPRTARGRPPVHRPGSRPVLLRADPQPELLRP